MLDFYALKWCIEDWHRILKNDCEVEKNTHSTAERIKRALTLDAVIAWRLSVLTLLGRATPEISASPMFGDAEITVLLDYAGDMGFKLPCHKNPDKTPEIHELSLREAVLLVVRFGGYFHRKNDTPTGHQVVWNGYF
ncbi:MAG: hypothetical protein OXC62_04925 [Aestuariivita sp.]|nr:hypothetical protein [Aestuariivita sp.]